jgi:hypothetical protein
MTADCGMAYSEYDRYQPNDFCEIHFDTPM